jgi:hypothetical protein
MPDRQLLLLEWATSAVLLLASGLLLLLLLLGAMPLVLLLLVSPGALACGETIGTTLPASTSS